MSKERRVLLRRKLTPINASFRTESAYGLGLITNLTKAGLFLHTATLPAVQEKARVLFVGPDASKIEVEGTVIWTTDQLPEGHEARKSTGFGMRLDRTTDEFLEFFEHVLTN